MIIGLEKILQADNVDYYISNDTINIKLDSCIDGIEVVKKYEKHIEEFEILRGDMDDVFLNITGGKLVNQQ